MLWKLADEQPRNPAASGLVWTMRCKLGARASLRQLSTIRAGCSFAGPETPISLTPGSWCRVRIQTRLTTSGRDVDLKGSDVAKIVDANKRFISDVLGGAASVEIPDYQRSYSWTNDELTALWDDVTGFEQRFPGQRIDEGVLFLGSLVAIRDGRRLRLLDGQQRIATLTIFLAAVRDALALHDAALAGRLHDSLIQEVTRPGRPPQYRLSLGVPTADVFAAAVQEFPVRNARRPYRRHRTSSYTTRGTSLTGEWHRL